MIGKLLRKLPKFRGKQRLAKTLLGSKIEKFKNVSVTGRYGCKYFLPNIIENIGFDLYINGIYEKETIDFLIKNIPKNKVFIDLGANIGSICLPICMVRKDLKVLCVEAAPWIFEVLTKNTQDNFVKNTTLINKAIFDVSNKKMIFYTPHKEFGKGSLLPFFSKEEIIVETITLADIIKDYEYSDIGFIKIDIEGYEYFALKGASDFLSSPQAPDILFEFVDWAEGSIASINVGAAQNLLIEYGYSIFVFDNGKLTKKVDQVITKGTYMFFATKSNWHKVL